MSLSKRKCSLLMVLLLVCLFSWNGFAQTAGTGALAGVVSDSSGAVVPGAKVTLTNIATGETHISVTGNSGRYELNLLAPGAYRLEVIRDGFKTATLDSVAIAVTETAKFNVTLKAGGATETVVVTTNEEIVQTESSTLGRVVDEKTVSGIPLVTRNFTQILALSPGVSADVNNASALGRGAGGQADGGVHVNGARGMDNNFQMDGAGINDLQADGASSGGVAIPNPDTIKEFKVQTSLYDATFGRNAGGNVNIVTKSGSNKVHGTLFEFLRNTDLNANDYFSKQNNQARGVLNQNQFGGTVGFPFREDKLLAFASYQGTRQKNGLAPGCSSNLILPGTLTNDRSRAGVGAAFAGQAGLYQTLLGYAVGMNRPVGPTILADGSNIDDAAYALMSLKLPNGQYYVPTPQTVVNGVGSAVFHNPCSFDEDQGMGNMDYLQSARSTFALRYFVAESNQEQTFPVGGISGFESMVAPGSTQTMPQVFHVVSFGNTYAINPHLLNEAKVAYHRTSSTEGSTAPFTFSSVGMNAQSFFNSLPSITIAGCCQFGAGSTQSEVQNSYSLIDSVSHVLGKHNLRYGGEISRSTIDIRKFRFPGTVEYESFPDFLLGLDAAHDGLLGLTSMTHGATPPFSNLWVSINYVGQPDRSWVSTDGALYLQDDYHLNQRLTLNLGLRYERVGAIGDKGGRNGNFNPLMAEGNPGAAGSLAGYIVPSNFRGTVPSGVTKSDNTLGIAGDGQNAIGPRVGFSYQVLPSSSRLVLRGGYGIYYSHPVGIAAFQMETSAPFGALTITTPPYNGAASNANPFIISPPASSFPLFTPYSTTSPANVIDLAQGYRPPITGQYSLGLQTQLHNDLMLEIAYAGSRGTHLIRTRDQNQASLASASNPINGETTNTYENISSRVPYMGFAQGDGIRQLESEGASWYNGLQAGLTKRLTHGLQFMASYTYSRTLDTDGVDPDTSAQGGTPTGNQGADPKLRYGPSLFARDQRFVASYVYDVPDPLRGKSIVSKLTNKWALSGVTTVQSGQHLTLSGSNAYNAYGIAEDRVQLQSGCKLAKTGSIQQRLTNYFNTSCVTDWNVIGSDGLATDFGNSGVGIVKGPGQQNYDIALTKLIPVFERYNLDFRSEFFNTFNHAIFANPGTSYVSGGDTSGFGAITTLASNPRIVQFALKLLF
jgi:hypothetical protein